METKTMPGMESGMNTRIGKKVTIEPGASIGNNVVLGENVIIRKGAVIGDNAVIGYVEPKAARSGMEPPLTEIGENTLIRSGSVVYSGTRIGADSMVGHNSVLRENTIVGHHTYIGTLSSVEGDTRIGNFVGIQSHCYITKYCNIGDYTFIAPGFIGANDNAMTHRRPGHGQNLEGFTTEKYVRIAAGVVVLPEVHFGEGCIVAAGSLVTKDVPAYKLVMGFPARVVRDAPRDQVTPP